jgi:hypothetical protein
MHFVLQILDLSGELLFGDFLFVAGLVVSRRGKVLAVGLFVTLVTEVSLISREPNFRFERISISRRFLWKSFSSFPFCTRRRSHGVPHG